MHSIFFALYIFFIINLAEIYLEIIKMKIKITGIGSYIPEKKIDNTDFSEHVFLNEDGTPFAYPNEVVINKFKGITGIEKRRYAEDNYTASDLAFFASQKAIENAGIDRSEEHTSELQSQR